MTVRTLEWINETDGFLRLIDQTRLPSEKVWVDCRTVPQVIESIKALRVRGAPAIGVSAAYGVVIAAQSCRNEPADSFRKVMQAWRDALFKSRPTAVNLGWALDEMQPVVESVIHLPARDRLQPLLDKARQIEAEDVEMCRRMGLHGAPLLKGVSGALTHCNAGALATAGEGTALAVLFEAARRDPQFQVFADETRPLWQGSRLTAWELMQNGVPCTIICDNMAAVVMKTGKVQAVVVGADRIAANGDVANKIGTYSVAVLAKHHGIPFYVAAPTSTFDMTLESGSLIPIEERASIEITSPYGIPLGPEGARVFNPAFDVTPAELVTAIITEKGVISPVTSDSVFERVLGDPAPLPETASVPAEIPVVEIRVEVTVSSGDTVH